ncbi:hypothetical protein FLLO111716_07605 [Flavobacterium longum]|uniref:hypothetical protein n=1 Tax=Flavobacterium longum TaxID=1299340 RepID=UPI0039E85315
MSIFLPFEKLTYSTKLSREEALAKLAENIAPEKPFGFGTPKTAYDKPYVGQCNGNAFNVKRAIGYRNSFLPMIKGEVVSDISGTKVQVTMRPNVLVLVFMAFWMTGVGAACVFTVFSANKQDLSVFSFIPFVMLFFGIGMLYGGFKIEANIAKKDLARILEAR